MNQTTIDPTNLARLTLQEKLAKASGFALPPPLFALGTPVVALGVENFRKSRAEFDALPKAADVFAPFIARIAAEARVDVTVGINDLRLREDGALLRSSTGKTILLDGPRSLRGLLDRTPCEEPGAAAVYLATIPAARRAGEVNEWLRAADADATAVLRTRRALVEMPKVGAVPAGVDAYARECFAVVSEKYGVGLEVDVLAKLMVDAISKGLFPGDARAEVLYDGRTASIKAVWHSNIKPETACAGEVFKTGAGITSRDDGGAAIDVVGEILRNLCLNFIIIGTAKRSFGSRRHVGDVSDLTGWLFEAFANAAKSVRGFADLWDAGRAKRLDDPSVTRDVPKAIADHVGHLLLDEEGKVVAGVFRGLAKTGKLALPGYRGEAAIDVLVKAWEKEPEFNKVGIVNAVTRAAHEADLPRAFAAEELEAAGGAILANPRPFTFVEKGDVF